MLYGMLVKVSDLPSFKIAGLLYVSYTPEVSLFAGFV